jgi:FkbM family methyltransferase
MKREHRQTIQSEMDQEENDEKDINARKKTAVRNQLLNATFRLADRYDVPPFVGKIYWELEKAYCLARIAASGGELDAQIADTTVQFVLSTRSEYQRAKDLGGERAVIEALLAELSGTETVWDVGACVGTYTSFIANVLTTGTVVGFEPEATNRSRLRKNLVNNASARWKISSVALSDENGTCTLSSEFVEAGGGHHYLANKPGRPVETRRGDSLRKEQGLIAPDVIKIDVQGAELAVLSGLEETLTETRSIYLEIHPEKCGRYGTTAAETEAFLRDAGYSLTYLGTPTDRRSGVYFVHSSRQV